MYINPTDVLFWIFYFFMYSWLRNNIFWLDATSHTISAFMIPMMKCCVRMKVRHCENCDDNKYVTDNSSSSIGSHEHAGVHRRTTCYTIIRVKLSTKRRGRSMSVIIERDKCNNGYYPLSISIQRVFIDQNRSRRLKTVRCISLTDYCE